MTSFAQLIPPAASHLSATESTAYEERRERCLWILGMSAAENLDQQPDEYLLTLYRGYVAGRWEFDYITEDLTAYYAQLAAGTRLRLPCDRLSDPDQQYVQAGEGFAQRLLSAVYRVWRQAYVPPLLPHYGPHLVGQEPAQPAAHVFSRAQRAALVNQACQLLSDEQRARLEERARRPLPPHLSAVTPTDFEREVLSSYLAREIGEYTARQLLVTHGESPQYAHDGLL